MDIRLSAVRTVFLVPRERTPPAGMACHRVEVEVVKDLLYLSLVTSTGQTSFWYAWRMTISFFVLPNIVDVFSTSRSC
jgi:hypothetical protein